MTARRNRAARAARAAQQVEDGAKLAAFQSRQQVAAADVAIEIEVAATGQLLASGLAPGLRAMLATAGTRHLEQLHQGRSRLELAAVADRQVWDRARIRVRSLDKLVERLDAAQSARDRLAENAEWQDIVTSRATGAGPHLRGGRSSGRTSSDRAASGAIPTGGRS